MLGADALKENKLKNIIMHSFPERNTFLKMQSIAFYIVDPISF